MRQKEMSYQQSARVTPMPPPSFFAPSASQPHHYGSGGGAGFGLPAAPQSPVTPGFTPHFGAKTGGVVPRGSVSPLSVGQLPYSNNYDQFGYTWHWIAGVCAHFALQRQTAHFAIQYAHIILRKRSLLREHDAFSIRNYDDVFAVQRDLQLLGITCVFMATKIEEVHPPKATELAKYISEQGAVTCAGDDLVRYEGEYLVELNWNLHPTTPLSWLLFLLAGDSSDPPLDTMGDFSNPKHNLSGTKELFVAAVRLIDVALLDYQSIDFLPSVIAGSALLLVDPSLDFLFVAQFLQLDPNVLWECKNWLYGLVYGMSDWECPGSQDRDRWAKVANEEFLFIQAHITVPNHLAYGLLRPESTPYFSSLDSNQHHFNCGCDTNTFGGYQSTMCASPSSSDNYGCMCKDGYHTCGGYGPHVYHFKYGWQGIDGGLSYDAGAPEEQMPRFA
ncbi:G1/s-specific cyclin e, partial [Globisporangium splendens]